MKKIISSAFIGYVVLALFMLPTPLVTLAQANGSMVAEYTLLEPLPCLNDGTQTCADGKMITEVNFANYVRYAFNLIIALSAVSAVLVIVAGGFRYVTTDSFQGKNDGKKMIIEALKGLLLVLCSFLILRTIDPRLVDIPTTLVTPLKINYEKGVTDKYFSTMVSELDKLDKTAQEATKAAQLSRDSIKETDKQIADLQAKKSTYPENSSEATAIQKQIDALKSTSQYKTAQEQIQIQNTKSTINRLIQQTIVDVAVIVDNVKRENVLTGGVGTGAKINAAFDSSIEFIETTRQQKTNALIDLGSSQDKIQLINNETYYGTATLLTKKTAARIDRATIEGTNAGFNESILNLNIDKAKALLIDDLSRAQIAASKITDPIKRSSIQNEISSTYKKLNQKFAP